MKKVFQKFNLLKFTSRADFECKLFMYDETDEKAFCGNNDF